FFSSAQGLKKEFQENLSYKVLLKQPGNPAEIHSLQISDKNTLAAKKEIPLKINYEMVGIEDDVELTIQITALADVYFNFQGQFTAPALNYDTAYLYLPGFWYRKNLRSPENAPSARLSKNWIVREDRLSTPLVGIYD